MQKILNNYAFIDSQNLNITTKKAGWNLDWERFRIYLKDKYGTKKAYLFLGYIEENKKLYNVLESYGYTIIFKRILKVSGEVKGNIDAELVLQAMIDLNHYNKAIIVTNDGDFTCLVEYLLKIEKFYCVLSPNIKRCSVLLKKATKNKISCLTIIKEKLKIPD